MLMRDISRRHLLARDMQLQWRRVNNQRPVTSSITISSCRTIQNPLLEVLILAPIRILTETVLLSHTSHKWSILYLLPAESDNDEKLYNSNW